ncbi:HNH endonuclease [Microbacterium sp. A196]|uniref:HNH endonuclease n=1 Tax=Microbacterium sp. A196 TaxID=3457320 RepID=UPI003FD020ED
MRTHQQELAIRNDVFHWLDQKFIGGGGYEIHHTELKSYEFQGERIPLLDTGKGIRNPATFSSTLSIMSGWKTNRYNDHHDDTGWVTYSYRAGEGGDNVKLVRAYENQDPIIYFRAVREGYYFPYYPILIAENDHLGRVVRFPLEQSLTLLGDPMDYTAQQRSYAETIVRSRLHQPLFRAKVLHAYSSACAICDLRHAGLLDAAHIIPDSNEHGVAHVSNGLALCKLHHAAYDRSFLGITPDYKVQINERLMGEVDGPMLRHGLQEMHGRQIRLPSTRTAHPSRENLALRFEEFTKS